MQNQRARHVAFIVVALLWAALPGVPARAEPGVGTPEGRPRVALVLSGGAARGAAHVGVLQELVAAGIPIDMIVGTSIGAIVGGLYAAGFAADELPELLVFVDPTTTARSQLPLRGGVLDNAPLGRILAALFEDRWVADTRIPFRGIVTDLLTGETHAPADAGQWLNATDRAKPAKAVLVNMRHDDTDLIHVSGDHHLFSVSRPLFVGDQVTHHVNADVVGIFANETLDQGAGLPLIA